MAVYEIKLRGRWWPINYASFRAFAGERRIDGVPYRGPVYFLGTDTVARWEAKPPTTEANK